MTSLITLLLFLSSVGYIRFFSQREDVGIYKAPFLYCCFVSLFVFIFSLIGMLPLGAEIVLGIGCFLCLFELPGLFKLHTYKNATTVNLLIILPFFIFFRSISDNFNFLLWDEFSFWASSAKIIFETNALFNENSPIFLKSYPPIQQLFQYYFAKFTFWSEKNVLYAQTFWVLSALLCVAGSVAKHPINVALTFIISSSFLYFFSYSYSTIYSDPLLGVCFAACLALAYDQRGKLNTVAAFFGAIAALVLIKEIAILLALVAVSVFVVCFSLCRDPAKSSLNRILYTSSITLVGLGTTVGVLKSWAWYVAKIHATRDVVLPSLNAFSESAFYQRALTTLSEFFTRILKPGYLTLSTNISVSAPSVVVTLVSLFVLSVGCVFLKSRAERLKNSLVLLLLFVGAAGYAGALVFSYLVFFTEYEGIRLASFERYFSSYMLAWLLILFALFASTIDAMKSKYLIALQVGFGILVFFCVPRVYFDDMRSIASSGEAFRIRQNTEDLAAKVKKYIKPGEKVYFVAQNSNGLERTMFYYAMLPFTSSMSWCWSIGKKYFEGDVWSCDTRLPSLLDGYKYLAVYRGDEQLWNSATGLFDKTQTENGSPSLFAIDRVDNSVNGKIDAIRRLE
jgi:hypothetical protein